MTARSAKPLDAVDALNEAIAQRIALLRKGRQQSFDELALRSGVSKGMLVQIEQGRANPSIGTLCRLASGLGVSMTDLISEAAGASKALDVVNATDARTLWMGPKSGSAVLRVGAAGPDMLELWHWTLNPGERYESRAHSAGTSELVHVESGELVIEVDGESHRITVGNCCRLRADRPHAYVCGGKKKTVFSMVVFEPAVASAVATRSQRSTP